MRKTITTLATVAAAVAGATVATASSATAAGSQVYQGTGWKLESSMTAAGAGIHALDPTAAYTITFADSAARSALSYYYTPLAAWMSQETGAKFTVSATNQAEPTSCSTTREHVIVVGWKTEPVGEAGLSHTGSCYNTQNNTMWGGWIDIDKEYWDHPGWFSGTGKDTAYDYAMIWNATAHELGHAVGLDHPNTRDSSGNVKPYDCVTNSAGWRPLMCSPNGGPTDKTGINYTAYDIAGIKQLVANYALPAPASASSKAEHPADARAMPVNVTD
jgi:hypothetical protein